MEPVRTRFIVAGVVLLAVSLAFFLTSTNAVSNESTFAFGVGKLYRFSLPFAAGTTIEGRFQEISSRPVNFHILSSAQYAGFANGTSTASLYGIGNVVSATVSFVTTVPDEYNLVFTHGSGVNDTQTVHFERTFKTQNLLSLVLGPTFAGLAALDFFIAFRRPPPGRPVPAAEAPRPPDTAAP